MSKPDNTEILEYFLMEAEDYINTLDRGISELGTASDSDALIEDLFRAAHTLKGSASIARMTETTKIAHKMEDILEELKGKKIRPTRGIVDMLRFMLDSIKRSVQNISENKKEDVGIYEDIIKIVNETLLKEREKAHIEPSEDLEKPQIQAKKEFSLSGKLIRIDISTIEEMAKLIEDASIRKNSLIQKTKDISLIPEVLFNIKERLLKTIEEFPSISEKKADFDIFMEKLKKAAGDISEAQEYLNEFIKYITGNIEEIDNKLEILRSLIYDLRMIEVDKLFQRFAKLVKEIASQNNKKVELTIQGGNIRIDKTIMERLFDPLIHIARNAIIHGIEDAEYRIKMGKNPEGLLAISARSENNSIVIDIKDDGKGIDTEIIRKAAIKKGILRPDDKPSKEWLMSLIFSPGFTTAESSDIGSGRGMGLSAAKKQISDINGTIEVISDSGRGTIFRISIPSSIVSLT